MSRTVHPGLATVDCPPAMSDPFDWADQAEHEARHWPSDPDGDDQHDWLEGMRLDEVVEVIDVDARVRRRYAEPADREPDPFMPGCVR